MSKEDELKSLEEQIHQLNAEINMGYNTELLIEKNIEDIQRQIKKQIEELDIERKKIHADNWHKRKLIRELNERRELYARQAEEEERNKSLRDKFQQLMIELQKIRNNFQWSGRIMQHQWDGGSFITLQKRLILADPMGLGKTLTVISALDLIKEATKDASPSNPFITDAADRFPVNGPAGKKVLYLSSSELSYNVWDEFKQWAPHRNVVFLTGFSKDIRRVVIDTLKHMSEEYVVIFNYEGWRKDLNILPIISELDFDTIIFDESHKLKEGERNIGFRGTSAIMSGTPSPYRIAMTGTPVLNKPQELYPQLHLLDPYLFYNEKLFLNEYCTQIEDDQGKKRWIFRPGGLDSLYAKIGPIILRRTKQDAGIELPSKTIIHHEIDIDEELYPHQARARREMRTWGSIALDPENHEKGFVSAAAQIAVLTRLRQIEAWPAGIKIRDPLDKNKIIIELDVHESQKMDYIINPVADMGLATEALSSGERLIIFSQFVENLKEYQRRFIEHGYRACLFIGDTSRDLREEIKRDFDASKTKREDAKWDIVLSNYKLGGEGVNFTGASQMIIPDEEWNPGKRDQAYDRMNRIGQELPMTIHVIRVKETVDSWMAELINFKEELVDGFQQTFSKNEAYNALREGKI